LGADVSCIEAHGRRTTGPRTKDQGYWQRVELEWNSAACDTHTSKMRLKLIPVI